eukprot:75907-Prymnesium_polylepis.1
MPLRISCSYEVCPYEARVYVCSHTPRYGIYTPRRAWNAGLERVRAGDARAVRAGGDRARGRAARARREGARAA